MHDNNHLIDITTSQSEVVQEDGVVLFVTFVAWCEVSGFYVSGDEAETMKFLDSLKLLQYHNIIKVLP